MEQTFARALSLHQRGDLAGAERLYRQVLAAHPHQPDALNLLGVLALQSGRNEQAIDLISRALARNDRVPDFHNNLAEAYRRAGRLDEAAAHFAKVVELEPKSLAAHLSLAAILRAQGKWDLAAARYRRLLQIRPDLPDARDGLADTYRSMATACLEQGQSGLALDAARRAVDLTASLEDKLLFVRCAGTVPRSAAHDDAALRTTLLRAWSELWGRPSDLAWLSVILIKRNPAVAAAIARAKHPEVPTTLEALWGPTGLAAPAGDRLLRTLIESAPAGDADLERVLTATRRIMLDLARSGEVNDIAGGALVFCCALARQCFINEYVFAFSDEEVEKARALRDALAAALQSAAPIPPLWPVAVASYWPLHEMAAADALLQRAWPEPLACLLAQQIMEPREEMRCRDGIARLTSVDDAVSREVRQQYEENPYPRWVALGRLVTPTTLQAALRAIYPEAAVNDGGDILIAGCGTGQQAIETALTFPQARVLAIDLSLSALAYARRKTQALGVRNIEYAQADILRLGALGRTFDLIESVGVLHHLADPFAGWRVLLKLLRPRGVMRLGLYSEAARRHVVDARNFIAERGYQSTASDIRRCRQDLMMQASLPNRPNIAESRDFFTTSTCRDLLFHVAEQRMTLPQIAAFLAAEGLVLFNLQVEASMAARYRKMFPGDTAMTNLANWHAFETQHPYTFAGMYQFWVYQASGIRHQGSRTISNT